MTRTVGDVGDEVHIGPFRTAKEAVHGVDQDLYDVNVLPLVEAANVVGLGHLSLVENEVYCPGVVLNVQPVTHILTLSVHGKRLTVTDVVDEKRDQFLRELIRAVVVGTVGHNCRKTEGVVESPHKVVTGCLGSAIRAVRLILEVLSEELLSVSQVVLAAGSLCCERRLNALRVCHLKGTVYFVGGDVVEAFALILLREALPISLGGLQKAQRTHHVGLGKGEGILDGAVHVGFRCKVDDAVHVLLLHKFQDTIEVADVHLHKAVVGLVLNVLEVGKVSRICEFVQVDDPVLRVFVHKQPDDVASDESGTAGYDDSSFH